MRVQNESLAAKYQADRQELEAAVEAAKAETRVAESKEAAAVGKVTALEARLISDAIRQGKAADDDMASAAGSTGKQCT